MPGRQIIGRCWPGTRSRSWQVQARGGAGHAADTWRGWMEPVKKRPVPAQLSTRMLREDEPKS